MNLATMMSCAIIKMANQIGKKVLLFWTTLMGYSFEVIFNRAIMALFYQDSRSNPSVIIQKPKKKVDTKGFATSQRTNSIFVDSVANFDHFVSIIFRHFTPLKRKIF